MDLEIAKASIDIGTNLANVAEMPEYKDVDLPIPDDITQFISNSQGASDGIEINQDVSGNWAVAHCARRVTQRQNEIEGGTSSSQNSSNPITWKATDALPEQFKNFLATSSRTQAFQPPTGGGYPTGYIGPRWRAIYQSTQSEGADDSEISNSGAGATVTPASSGSTFYKYSTAIEQTQSSPGIWWGVEANVNYEKEEGCWIDIQRSGEKSVKGQESWILIILNGAASGLAIWMTPNKRPKLINLEKNTQEDMSTVGMLSPGGGVRLGVLNLCGRLIFNFNGSDYIYSLRSNSASSNTQSSAGTSDHGQFDFQDIEFTISDVAVFATNCQAIVKVSDMTFAKGTLRTPAMGSMTISGEANGGYSGDMFTIEGPEETTYGASSEDHAGGAGKVTMFWEQSSNRGNTTANVIMEPSEDKKRTPAVHRIYNFENANTRSRSSGSLKGRGISIRKSSKKATPRAGGDILSISMQFEEVDSYHSKQSAEVTVYNPGGIHDDWMETSQGISISCGWGTTNKLFTGVTLGGYRSETAGLETLVLHCEDYMFILDSMPMIDSPYYDGKYAFNVVADLALRCGINPVDDSTSPPYALPQAYNWMRPLIRFSKGRTIKDCIVDIVKYTQCTVYFDQDGVMHYTDIQGGIHFGGGSSTGSIVAAQSGKDMILDELRTEARLSKALNAVGVKTVDRTSGQPIYLTRHAKQNNLFKFLRLGLNAQAAYGSWQTANAWCDMTTQRVFKVPQGVTAKTASDIAMTPMTYVTVAGQQYRLNSIQRSYSAEENSLTTTISGEWYG
ncbi:MAG: hypothetical protein M0R32_11210 [Candidatus Cloacimonetes bacterium]|jgi:hypothetical protein|nr:hypothetical protein [Candidatus Cloacimonadota bacterium]